MTHIIPHTECETYHPRNNSSGNLFAFDEQEEAMCRLRLSQIVSLGATAKNTALFANFIPNTVALAFRMRYDSLNAAKQAAPGETASNDHRQAQCSGHSKPPGLVKAHSNHRRCWVNQRAVRCGSGDRVRGH